jgi:L-asparaginase
VAKNSLDIFDREASEVVLLNAGGTIVMDARRPAKPLPSQDFLDLLSRQPGFGMRRRRLYAEFPCPADAPGAPGATREVKVHYEAAFKDPPDSSEMTPQRWGTIAEKIMKLQKRFPDAGVVVLHGTDTMAWTASAVSFLIGTLERPVIFTGSQCPLIHTRNDALRNLVSAIQFALRYDTPPEVLVMFDTRLMRGNRTTKGTVTHLRAFDSPNFPAIGEAGVGLNIVRPEPPQGLNPCSDMRGWKRRVRESSVLVHRAYPGCRDFPTSAFKRCAVVIEAYGAGTADRHCGLEAWVRGLRAEGVVVVLRSQVPHGTVDMDLYGASDWLRELGVIAGADITSEACIAKLYYLLGRGESAETITSWMSRPIRGERASIEETTIHAGDTFHVFGARHTQDAFLHQLQSCLANFGIPASRVFPVFDDDGGIVADLSIPYKTQDGTQDDSPHPGKIGIVVRAESMNANAFLEFANHLPPPNQREEFTILISYSLTKEALALERSRPDVQWVPYDAALIIDWDAKLAMFGRK